MTKVIFVSDIHLNLKRNREFEENRVNQLFDFIDNYEADIVVLGGDIFDTSSPTLDELSLFYNNIEKLSKDKTIYLLSGNHEDINKKECVFDLIPQVNYKYFDITHEPIIIDNVALYFASHHKLNEIKKINVVDKTSVLFSHIRCNIGIVKAELPLSPVSKKFDKVFLGDIHVPFDVYHNIHYCGSPYTVQYEIQRTTGVFEIILNKGTVKHKFIKTDYLPQKVKLDLTVEDYNDIYNSLDSNNLYKIYISGNLENFYDIVKKDNFTLVFENVVDTEEYQESIDTLLDNKSIDLITTLHELVCADESLSSVIKEKGKSLLEAIKRGIEND